MFAIVGLFGETRRRERKRERRERKIDNTEISYICIRRQHNKIH
jgi:hypothetical protein